MKIFTIIIAILISGCAQKPEQQEYFSRNVERVMKDYQTQQNINKLLYPGYQVVKPMRLR